MDYKYLSQPQKPLFSVARALVYLIILLVNLFFWSSNAFADKVVISGWNVYRFDTVDLALAYCGGSFEYSNDRAMSSTGSFSSQWDQNYRYLNNCTGANTSSDTKSVIFKTLDSTLSKPSVVETCNYGANINEMVPQISGNWTEGLFELSGVSYKYRIETETEIKYSCDILHRYDVICHANNAAAVPEFDIAEIKDYPKHSNTVQLAYQGCLYDAILTSDVNNKWDGECYNATFLRTDNPSDQIGSVDFSSFACELKTCPNGFKLDENYICQPEEQDLSCPNGFILQDNKCVMNPPQLTYKMTSCRYADTSLTSGTVGCNLLEGRKTKGQALSYVKSLNRFNYTGSRFYQLRGKYYADVSANTNGSSTSYNSVRATLDLDVLCNSGSFNESTMKCETSVNNNTPKTCPDGSEIPNNENCPTKICPNGSQIPFDYVCPTEPEPGTGTSGFFQGEYTKFTAYLDSDVNAAKVDLGPQFVGFYEVEYPNGFDDVLEKHQESFDNSALKAYTNKWTQSVNGNISLPSLYTMCFDMSPIYNLGCFEIPIDNRVWSFIRVILIFSSVVLARKITLGA